MSSSRAPESRRRRRPGKACGRRAPGRSARELNSTRGVVECRKAGAMAPRHLAPAMIDGFKSALYVRSRRDAAFRGPSDVLRVALSAMINDDVATHGSIVASGATFRGSSTLEVWMLGHLRGRSWRARVRTRPLADEQDDCKQTRRAARRNAPRGTPPLRPSPGSSIPAWFRETERLPFNPGAPLRSGVRGSTFLVTSTFN